LYGKVHIKNILLGIGMGLVLTALTGIIYSAGREPQMSKEEIMAKARQYGMVPSNEIIEESENELVDEEEAEVEPAGNRWIMKIYRFMRVMAWKTTKK